MALTLRSFARLLRAQDDNSLPGWVKVWGESGEIHASHEFLGHVLYSFDKRRGETLIGWNVVVFEHNPQARAIAFFLGADGASELGDFHGMRSLGSEFEIGEIAGLLGNSLVVLAKDFKEHATGIVHQITKTLRDEYTVHITRGRVFEIDQVVIRERFLKRNFDGDRGFVGVRNNFKWHNKVLHYAGYFG